jgi:hypothetical protein
MGKSSLMQIDSRQMDVDDFWASAHQPTQQFCLHLIVFTRCVREQQQPLGCERPNKYFRESCSDLEAKY